MTIDTCFHLKNYKSFGPTGVELKSIRSINVIVGRNNIGKSALLHTLDYLCKDGHDRFNISQSIELTQILDEKLLMQVFRPDVSRGELGGNHWEDHGVKFVGASFTWKQISDRHIEFVKTNASGSKIELEHISGIHPTSVLRSFRHIKLDADRDIVPESINEGMTLSSDGVGATQIIHKYLQHVEFDRSLIQKKPSDSSQSNLLARHCIQ